MKPSSLGQHQATNILNRLHAGLELRLPVSSSTYRFRPFPVATGLDELVALWTWTCPLCLREGGFKWSTVCAVLAPPFKPGVHLP